MALFFDQEWFEARLAEAGLNRDTVAAALGLSGEQVEEIWKDQRELTVEEVTVLAALLGQPIEDVVNHAGIATPQPGAARPPAPGEASVPEAGRILERLDALDARMAGLEKAVSELSALLKSMREEHSDDAIQP
ncbi:hypothetical protein [Parvibaculum sp. MBR-TMA-1.3b-4.2]|jgi:transcriptional regulator with XRE-family HTH domain